MGWGGQERAGRERAREGLGCVTMELRPHALEALVCMGEGRALGPSSNGKGGGMLGGAEQMGGGGMGGGGGVGGMGFLQRKETEDAINQQQQYPAS